MDDNQVRNHVLRKSIDGGKTFAAPVEISDDGWQVPSCPHSGPSIGPDSRGKLHVTWFTLGRSEKEAGIYYSMSSDGGKSFAPRQLVHANAAPEILYRLWRWATTTRSTWRGQISMPAIKRKFSCAPFQRMAIPGAQFSR